MLGRSLMSAAVKGASAAAHDPYWSNVVCLLNFEGGTATDVSNSKQTVTSYVQTGGSTSGTGVVVNGTNPKFGSYAGYFPDNSSALSLPAQNLSSTFTLDFWVSLNSVTPNANEQIFCVRNSSNAAFLLQLNTDATMYLSVNNSYSAKSTVALAMNTYYHIAVVNNANSYKVYVNGTATNMTSSQSYGPNTSNFIIGGTSYLNGTGDRCINGNIDEFRITNGVARWTANFTPPTSADLTS